MFLLSVCNKLIFLILAYFSNTVVSDPCLPINYREQVTPSTGGQVITLQGTGIYDDCKNKLRHLLNFSTTCTMAPCALDGTYLPEIDYRHTQFYGFAEFYYTMEDLLHIGGEYNYKIFQSLARVGWFLLTIYWLLISCVVKVRHITKDSLDRSLIGNWWNIGNFKIYNVPTCARRWFQKAWYNTGVFDH